MGHSLHTMIRDLHRRRGRERRGLALAEGVRLVEEAVSAGIPLKAVVISPRLEGTERGRALKQALADRRVPTTESGDDELSELAATEHPQGVVAVIEPRRWQLTDIEVSPSSVIVVLDAVQDPGNVGTIVRTAHAFGAAGLIALPGTAELAAPKTLRATMGSLFRLPAVAAAEADAAAWLRDRKITVAGSGAGGVPFQTARLPRPLALVLGNEGAGARSSLAASATLQLAIPLAGEVESLNVAVAAGIFLHGVRRDR